MSLNLTANTPPLSMDSSGSVGGYPKDIIKDVTLDKKYLCGHCHLILREPMQSFCGHRFCRTCTSQLLKDSDEVPCPACAEEGAVGEFCVIKNGQIFPDNAMKREFLQWVVHCQSSGCTWEGSFSQYEVHMADCEFKTELCACGRSIPVSQMQQHLNTECPARKVVCPHCQQDVPAIDEQEHNRTCPKLPVQCDVCGKEMTREQLSAHYSGECSVRREACPYQCGTFIERENLEQHEGQCVVEHTRAIHVRVQSMEGRPPTTAASAAEPHMSRPVQVSKDIQNLQSKLASLERRVATSLGDTSSQSLGTVAASGGSGRATMSSSDGGNYAELERKVGILEEKVTAFENAAGVLENGIERGTTHIETVERNAQAERKALEQRVKALERSLAIKDVTTAELEQRIKTLEVSSYDGVLLWKITDFARKRQEAISGRTTSIYSPPFYTSRTGYKMCARMYLNGDGMGKGSYLSLFFVVMRHQYDALMRWPFRQKVTMILIDQNNRDHIIDAFRPDPSSSSFRKPTSEMNIASGCPLFCPISSLTSEQFAYVKDDTMYIKIIVDTADLNVQT